MGTTDLAVCASKSMERNREVEFLAELSNQSTFIVSRKHVCRMDSHHLSQAIDVPVRAFVFGLHVACNASLDPTRPIG